MKPNKRNVAATATVASAILVTAAGGLERGALAAPATALPTADLMQTQQILRVAFDYNVYQIQQELNDLGYDAGPVDGFIGTRTRSAIRAYQAANGLPVTGQATTSLLTDIRATAQARQQQQQQQQQQQAAQPKPAPDTSSQTSAETDLVLDVQAGLRRLGYDVPSVSGSLDQRTQSAIRSYQRDQKLLVDGRVSEQLAQHIESSQEKLGIMSDREKVMKVQQALNNRGYDAGSADGVMGDKTRTAIRTFQADAGTAVNGRVTEDLLGLLGIRTDASANATADASAGASSETDTKPAYRVVLRDDFSDGNFTASPRWTVAAGDFQVANGGALASEVKIEAPSGEDIGQQLLKGIVQSALGVSLGGPKNLDAIYAPAQITDSFRVDMKLQGDADRDGKFSFGPFRGNDVSQGYRVEYDAAASRPLRLLVVTSNGPAVVASASPSVKLTDGQSHGIVWERHDDSSMTVSIDGNAVLQAKDQTYRSGFDGFSMINAGGRWQVNEVTVEAEK